MCSQVSCVKVTCAPPCAAFAPAMQASIDVMPSASLPMRTPQTSVLLLDRACWRICRTTSLLMRTEGGLSFFCLDITQLLSQWDQAPLPCRRRANIRFRAPNYVPRKYRKPASQADLAYEHHMIPPQCIHEQAPRSASVHRADTGHLRSAPRQWVRTAPAVRRKTGTQVCESRRG